MTAAIISAAIISDCGTYRYRLSRTWDTGAMSLPICMLNPSTADASLDDPTIRRCIAFAKRDGFGGIMVINLFALRATNPKELQRHPFPLGSDNHSHWHDIAIVAAAQSTPILCAWGANADGSAAVEAFRSAGAEMVCLGRTKSGAPRHPLYIRNDQRFEVYP